MDSYDEILVSKHSGHEILAVSEPRRGHAEFFNRIRRKRASGHFLISLDLVRVASGPRDRSSRRSQEGRYGHLIYLGFTPMLAWATGRYRLSAVSLWHLPRSFGGGLAFAYTSFLPYCSGTKETLFRLAAHLEQMHSRRSCEVSV